MPRALDTMPVLTGKQGRALVRAWPCPARIARDLTCPECGWGECGQTFQSQLPDLIYCTAPVPPPQPSHRQPCGWSVMPKAEGLHGLSEIRQYGKYLMAANRTPLYVLAYLACQAWNPDLSILDRYRAEPISQLCARTVLAAGLGPAFIKACAAEGPIGSKTRSRELLREIRALDTTKES